MDKLIEQEAVGEVIKDIGGCKIAGDMNTTRYGCPVRSARIYQPQRISIRAF